MKIRVIYCLCRFWGGRGVDVEGSPPQWDKAMMWWARRWVSGTVPSALRSDVPLPEGGRKRDGGGGRKRAGLAPLLTGRGGGLPRLPAKYR